MNDEEILHRIRSLVEEEHSIRESAPVDPRRLARLEETLDQCWDLLRQRRARAETGGVAAAAEVRDVEVVERYRQ